ncbi:hypothetical protein [Nostoc sp.]|uniref:hypothetical protein n=1 Tax=Nostoc sp. TaxID=1180 RepID=UPI002FFB61B9
MQLVIKFFPHCRSAQESIPLTDNGSIIAAGTGGSSQGGDLNFQTGTLNIKNQAEVTVSNSGTGDRLSFITLLFVILLILTILI